MKMQAFGSILRLRNRLNPVAALLTFGLLAGCVSTQGPLTGKGAEHFDAYISDRSFRDYKAYAINAGLNSGGRAWGAATPDEAIERALARCQEYSSGAPCKLYAIGETVVYRMTGARMHKVKSDYVREVSTRNELSPRAAAHFRTYSSPKKPDFKAFVYGRRSEVSGWSYSFWDSRSAINRALQECRNRGATDCEVYALGNRIVFGATPEELNDAIREADKKSWVDPRK